MTTLTDVDLNAIRDLARLHGRCRTPVAGCWEFDVDCALSLVLTEHQRLRDAAEAVLAEYDRVEAGEGDPYMDWTGPLVDGPLRTALHGVSGLTGGAS